MAHIFIHIGYGKTGSTAIQSFLAQNRAALLMRRIYCPMLGLSDPLLGEPGFASADDFLRVLASGAPEQTAARIANALCHAARRCNKLVWSCESLFGHAKLMGEVARLVRVQHDVTFVVYLRNHVDWLVSAYMQWGIRHRRTRGGTPSFEQFMAARARQLDYVARMEDWRKCVAPSPLCVRSYDATRDVVADFAAACGVDCGGLSPPRQTYETPSYAVMALFKVLNDQNEGAAAVGMEALLEDAGVLTAKLHPVDPAPLSKTDAELEQLSATFDVQRRRLRKKFGAKLNAKPRPNRFQAQPHTSMQNTDLLAILALLCVRLGERVEQLEQEVAARRGGGFRAGLARLRRITSIGLTKLRQPKH